MFFFPGDIESLLGHLAERLDTDPQLMEACRPLIKKEAYHELVSKSIAILAQRLGQKAGMHLQEIWRADWAARVSWEASGMDRERREGMVALCQSLLDSFGPEAVHPLPANAKSSRAVLLLVDAILAELDRLPDLALPTEGPSGFDARPFFESLVQSLNSLLPYEQRDFPNQIAPSRVKLLLANLPDDAYFAVEIHPPSEDDPGRIQMGLHFDAGEMEKLARHFRRKIPSLIHSMGGKEISLEEGDGRLSLLLLQPYQPVEKLSAFMMAATLVGFIGSVQERMPRR